MEFVVAFCRRKRSHMGDEETGCGLSESNIRRWMKTVQNSAVKSSTPVADIVNIWKFSNILKLTGN